MLISLPANRAMLSADKVSMVTMVCWSVTGTVPGSTLVTAVEDVLSVAPVVALAA